MQDNIKGVAFDLDGTLYPNYRLNRKLLPFILKEWRLVSAFGKARKIIRDEQSINNCSLPADFYDYQIEITAKLLSVAAAPLKEKIERLIYRGWEPFFTDIKLFKGVTETLDAFRKAGYKLGLLSDFPPETKLENLKINGIWDAVLCSERCGALKPHPLSFEKLALAMSLQPENIIYVGNSRSYDVAGAAKAGMKTAWIKSPLFPGSGLKKPKPDFSFHNYRQLYNFMIQ
ncbi:MAG: HAD family hydrolase [Treponema sp.]|nr:HAD family hydrolase [Treponema sp.]